MFFALCLRAVSVQAIGLTRGGDDSLSLLAPEQKDMQCEQGCRFRPFCLPGPCSDDEDCATEPVVCTDETWESCKMMKVPCPKELRAELCAKGKDWGRPEVCQQRMGFEVYDREAQAAERAAAEEANRDPAEQEANKPPPPKTCMSMATPKEDDWCTMTCNVDEASCKAAKLCKCGSKKDIEGWRKEKTHKEKNAGLQPWEVKDACDLEARGCNQHIDDDCALATNSSCIEYFKFCMESPRIDANNQPVRLSTQQCLNKIADWVDECSTCNSAASKDAFTLYVGPNYENPNADADEAAALAEADAKAIRDAFDADAKKMADAAKIKSDAAAAEAKERADELADAALAAITDPPPFPPSEPPSPPSPPLPPSSPKMKAKDLLAASKHAAGERYTKAKETREMAEEIATAAREQAMSAPAGDPSQTAAIEQTEQAEEALTAATVAEEEAKAVWERAKDAADQYRLGMDAETAAAAAVADAETARAATEAEARASEAAAVAGTVVGATPEAAPGTDVGGAKEAEAAPLTAEEKADKIAAEKDQAAADAEAAAVIEEQKRKEDEVGEEQRRIAKEHEAIAAENDRLAAEAEAAVAAADAAGSTSPNGDADQLVAVAQEHERFAVEHEKAADASEAATEAADAADAAADAADAAAAAADAAADAAAVVVAGDAVGSTSPERDADHLDIVAEEHDRIAAENEKAAEVAEAAEAAATAAGFPPVLIHHDVQPAVSYHTV